MKRQLLLAVATVVTTVVHDSQAQTASLAQCGDPNTSARQAVQACSRALERDLPPAQRSRAALNLGLARLSLDNPHGAMTAFEVALAANPQEARALAGRGRARAALGMTAPAAVDFNRAVSLAGRDPTILSDRGAFRLRAGNTHGALDDFNAAARLEPRDMLHVFNRGLALRALGRNAEAERAFSTVIAIDPDDAEAWLNRGRVRGASSLDRALSDVSRAISLAPEWGLAHFERGLLLETAGRQAEADTEFRRAWELGHRDEALEERIRTMGQ